jgi:uncharacterized membrane protein
MNDMRRLIGIIFCFFLFFIVTPSFAVTRAQNSEIENTFIAPTETFYKANVLKILDQGVDTSYGMTSPFQKVLLKILDRDMSGKEITIEHGKGFNLDKSQMVTIGDTVLVVKSSNVNNDPTFQIADQYRLDKVIPIIIGFFVVIILLSGWQGVGSIVGMVISLGVIVKYIVPQILSGSDPLFVSIVGCLVIMVITIYLAHGFSRKTTVALVSTFITLVVTGLLSILFVKITHLTGLGTEDAASLKLGPTANINFRGLLLGGILIGSLGVLDDVTTGLSASIFELAKANPAYKFKDFIKSGLIIGREHIASLVNTLVLAYAGVSLPLFIVIVLNPGHYPMNVMLNDGLIIEEVVRTLAGSIGLVMAVPLTAFLAAYYVSKFPKNRELK